VIRSGSAPVTALNARQASRKAGESRRERRRLPQLERIDRLHVVVAVEKHMRARPVSAFADHDRMTRGRPHAGFEADVAKIASDEFGCGAALRLIGRIGGDGLNAHELE